MSRLDDGTVARLRAAADVPDLGERYEVRGPIGHGGSSVVYAAFDRTLSREVAVKVADAYGADAAALQRLAREARILAALEHPGIVPVHDTGITPDGRAYYVMTLVRGAGLADTAAALSLPGRIALFLKVCDTVAFAHAHGVVHRDLKPQNVMVGRFGEVLVLDWGVAAVAADSSAIEAGAVVGTPGFMAPEQAAGASHVDRRADVFALGGLLHGLLDAPLRRCRGPAGRRAPIPRRPGGVGLRRAAGRTAPARGGSVPRADRPGRRLHDHAPGADCLELVIAGTGCATDGEQWSRRVT
jgi:serine/threonine protein kinase